LLSLIQHTEYNLFNISAFIELNPRAGGMGTPGIVLAPPPDEWGVARVMWDNGMVYEHPLGRDGVVTVHCLRAERGGAYYRDHLAPLDTRLLLRQHTRGTCHLYYFMLLLYLFYFSCCIYSVYYYYL
jgi:hypothetical protein